MIPDKLTWPKGTKAVREAQRVIPPLTVPWESLDFTSKNLRWIDDPNGQTVIAAGVNGITLTVMGAGAKMPYSPDWQEQDARAALIAQLGLTVPVGPTAPA
jgi:hypothetical protein